uniref:Coiled-coil-helix-coiled-coil-helix domain containing 3 n=1 Tax=Callithrix jacchus TaxID=9483 RepID=A0A8I3ZZ29_CALJA
MGGTGSTRRVTFEADENENITVVKGIRLSENVIDRMKESSPSGSKSQRYSGAYGASVSDEELKRRVAEELALEQAKKESEDQKRCICSNKTGGLGSSQSKVADHFGQELESALSLSKCKTEDCVNLNMATVNCKALP